MVDELLAENLFSVRGKVALVTGGGTGIGKMIAKAFVRNGARVYIASRKLENLQKTTAELNSIGPGECYSIQADLTNKEECEKLAAEIARREPEGKLHILVHNSGTTWAAPLESIPESAWDRINRLNVIGVHYLTIACLGLLEKASLGPRDPARVVIIGSIAGLVGGDPIGSFPGITAIPYNVSKAAVHHLGKNLAIQLTKRGITVNSVAAGVFPTKMTAKFDKKVIISQTPLGRLGVESDIAGIVMYLTSPAGAFVTGAVIPVDGGVILGAITDAKL